MSERRYIDADALYEMARTNPNYKDFCRSQADLTSLRELLDEYPAADVEPVVRCNACVKWGKRDCKRNPCAIDISSMDEFCSDGERKEHMERSGSGELR